ncbi:hypothetical protein SAMN05216559_2002 [Halomicrobium zhouii]|uniref:Uncharacterized protein n=1 Tax=Halomicrobium zhouii TaxID=767519 RepID=A0A1I6L4A0_9EURY|nr:hypothetical protein [Halomicrobium zhouii]SFR98262.1 hypothetical protein SAMN05216559_2002 [Halomicrobium zhouii]
MKRRKVLSVLLGGGATAALGGVAVFEPDLITGPPRTQGDPISLGKHHNPGNVTEYYPSNQSVTYRLQGTENLTETIPFTEWAKTQSETIAANAVLQAIHSRFDDEVTGISIHRSRQYLEKALRVLYVLNGDGMPEMEAPNVPFEAILERAPSTVDLTVVLEGNEYEAEYPVVAERVTLDLVDFN